jgi:heme A synthase
MSPVSRTVVRLSVATLVVNLLVILWGAWVRASGSGAGCGNHWPTCNGAIIPRSPGVHTLIEFTHRASSAPASIMVVVLLIATWRALPPGHWARRTALAALVLLLIEAGIGAALVKFDLVAANASLARPLVLGLHLVNTQLLLSAIMLTGWWGAGHPVITRSARAGRGRWFVAALAALILVNLAGVFASLGDTLFPAPSLAAGLAADRSAASSVLLHIRVWHPALAVAVGCGLLVLAWQATVWRHDAAVARAARTVTAAVMLQWAIGAISLVLLVPVALQLLHLLVADLVWLAAIWLAAATLADQCERIVPATSAAASASNTVPAPSSR